MANSLIDRIKSASKIKDTEVYSESKVLDLEVITTDVPAMNIAFSGDIDGGYTAGITTWASPSKHFKTLFSLMQAKAYLDKHPDAIMMFFDSEFGSPQSYFTAQGIDTKRVVHIPIKNIEELKFEMMAQLEHLTRKDKVVMVVDSIGNLASIKEVQDAMDSKSTADMTRAKQLKSLFRIITPYLNSLEIPCIIINHTYKTMDLFPTTVVGGGGGNIFASNNIFVISKRQDKNSQKELEGFEFVIKIEKSRGAVENSTIPIRVSFDNGVDKYSGLLEIALEGGFVSKTKIGNANAFSLVDVETGEVNERKWKERETSCGEFFDPILNNPEFKKFVRRKYKLVKDVA